ncbi:tetratricopeptide (TPR) repeat protein/uncharacterized Zn finger protein (UPF0148 family) [Paraburkholderia graminis]|nr:tetratricopeptide (TPR) repeat protein/uncharacterized Zn finger protein (UPF0148 family) [Paraburkholderia graminis]
MKNCIQCDKPLFGAVKFCPFCGTATATGAAAAAIVPPTPIAPDAAASDATPQKSPTERVAVAARPPASAARPMDKVETRRKPVASTPVKPPREAKPEAAGLPDTPPSPKPKKPRKVLRNTVVGLIAVITLLAFVGRGASKRDALCNEQVDEATRLVQSGDLAGASEKSKLARESCTGNLAPKATALQALVSTALATRAQCARAYDTVTTRLHDGRLKAAISGLNQLPLACAGSADASQIKEQVEQASTAADAAEQQARTAIDAGDVAAAVAAVDDLARLDRFRTILPSLRAQIASIPATKAPVLGTEQAASASEPAPAIAAQPPTILRPAPQPVQPVAPAFNGQATAAREFLNDAQTALEQSRFDAAKTYIDSARRMDPNNPRIDALARVVRDRERQVLQDETTIK